jgi:hypothetical protein
MLDKKLDIFQIAFGFRRVLTQQQMILCSAPAIWPDGYFPTALPIKVPRRRNIGCLTCEASGPGALSLRGL